MNKIKAFFKNPTVKITLRTLAAVIIIVGVIFGSVFGASAAKLNKRIAAIVHFDTTAAAENVILMIGDGMGPNHLEATKAYYDLDSLYMETLSYSRGTAETFSRNSEITDSAAAATALSCGLKTNNGCIAWQGGKPVQNMTEYAATLDKKTGIVATETLTGATPSGFSAHSASRTSTDTIASSQFDSDVSLFMGAGKSYYDDKQSELSEHGFTYVTDSALLTEDLYDDERVFASFSSVAPYGAEHGGNVGNLADMSNFAVNYLSARSENGFFLMIEGSYIDKKSHSNDLDAMVKELRAFDEAVEAMVSWAAEQGNTAVIVTADHETGGLKYNGEKANELSDDMYTSGNHTATDVYWFAFCLTIPEMTEGRKIDNTDIALICRNLMKNYYDNTHNT